MDNSSRNLDNTLWSEAAEWHGLVQASPDDAELLRALEAWKAADVANAVAYADIEIAYATTRSMAEEPEMLALRHETLARMVKPRTHRWLAIAASLALLAIGPALWFTYGPPMGSKPPAPATAVADTGIYQTKKGERLTVTLDDGSTATLNTQSRLRVAYNDKERRLILEKGQALFDVAKGQTRPFMVVAGDRTIVAHGTMFDVRLRGTSRVEVALIEGEVSVENNLAPASRATKLKPKEILTVSAGVASVKPMPEPEQIVGWRDGMVVFENESLASAVQEMNRYTKQAIILGDPSLGSLPVSGAFRTGESGAFIEALQMYFPVRVTEKSDDKVVLVRAR